MVPPVLLASLLVTIDLHSIDGALSTPIIRGIQMETTAIWRPYGVEIRWVGGREAAVVVDVALTAIVERRPLPPLESPPLFTLGAVRLRVDLKALEPIRLSYQAVAELLDRRPADRRA